MNGRKQLVNRKVYKDIKRMDHQQVEAFCVDIYKSGYADGRRSVPGVDVKKVIEAVRGVKGIGEARTQKIAEAIEKLWEKEGGNEVGTDETQ